MGDLEDRRYANLNLPHARTIVERIGRSLEALGAFGEVGNGGVQALRVAYQRLTRNLERFDEDPPQGPALAAADLAAVEARGLVEAILATAARGDRLGQCVRNLFECLGLAEEGATLSLQCGENPDSPLR